MDYTPYRCWLTIKIIVLMGLVPVAGRAAQGQDAAMGRTVFQTNCAICHTIQPNRSLVGPSLFGIVGRQAGTIAGFHYSPANKSSGLTFDAATLDRYLTSPGTQPPDTTAAARALHYATRRLRAAYPGIPTAWAAHVHIGM